MQGCNLKTRIERERKHDRVAAATLRPTKRMPAAAAQDNTSGNARNGRISR
jgi:hypothetical protein